ncbi:unnamed protein product [Closterium sp. NIES-53]
MHNHVPRAFDHPQLNPCSPFRVHTYLVHSRSKGISFAIDLWPSEMIQPAAAAAASAIASASATSARPSALSAYRTLLRAIRKSFPGDQHANSAGRAEVRGHFEGNRGEADERRLAELERDARDAAEMLRTMVVQARLNDRGNFGEPWGQRLEERWGE